ncbi:hypothetical protein Trydic_g741 [Trypoxylus dichotomus]
MNLIPLQIHLLFIRFSKSSAVVFTMKNGTTYISKSVNSSPNHYNLSKNLQDSNSQFGDNISYYTRSSETGSLERLDVDNKYRRIITRSSDGEDNIHVVVRVRPLNSKENKIRDSGVIKFLGNGQIMCDVGIGKPKIFSYNAVFEPAATQEDILQYSGVKRLIEMAVEGFRCTIFCYGQTGSGKTHTLTGPPKLFLKKLAPYSEHHGLIFRAFLYLFQLLQEKSSVHFVLKASFLEIYNEKVIDLLNPGIRRKPLAVRWSKKCRGFFVENLFTVDCEELDDLIAVLEEGIRNRSMGRHNMNDYSSRSHTILTVYITSEQPTDDGVFISRSGKINFVDLAGSEMTKKTQSAGKTLQEANNINNSLMVLGYCISSLSEAKRKCNHIPYRDSQLTKLLADSLAGNGVTLMIACISPAKSNLNETLNTLRYASRAKKVRTKPIVMMDPREALILTLKNTVHTMEQENDYLRSMLRMFSQADLQRCPPTPLYEKIDIEHISKLDNGQLIELVQLYASENEAIRKENTELHSVRFQLLQDQEIISRENERLIRKLEDVTRTCCRSPLIAARSTFSADNINKIEDEIPALQPPDIWRSSDQDLYKYEPDMPQAIQKELHLRRIGFIPKSSKASERLKPSDETPTDSLPNIEQQERNFKTATIIKTQCPEVFGSLVKINLK